MFRCSGLSVQVAFLSPCIRGWARTVGILMATKDDPRLPNTTISFWRPLLGLAIWGQKNKKIKIKSSKCGYFKI
ncbi:hypothetical protein BDV37DRAFT_241479 [Aspergillus pseudonomiae]|uniref:Uncharacterized protein n=1 Tax=Aspergillus pseudonomiae TaxID=1506151 RepID=A0A5N7DLH4_9EURO|nr:uncharacterized protein BDV37DRAFT_241479 [Aspergillus pseudonomiae]KAE8407297.1 hypothetical protein BDV37DRAFT_241479 [Aspergillus pseudonomiae]